MELKKDLIPYTECKDCILIGDYLRDKRSKGTDTVNRKDIPLISTQVANLINVGKDIILEGDKICARSIFNAIKELGQPIKLYWVMVSPQVSYARNVANGSTCSFSHLKAVCTKAQNIYYEYEKEFNGEVIDTTNVSDFSKLSRDTYVDNNNDSLF